MWTLAYRALTFREAPPIAKSRDSTLSVAERAPLLLEPSSQGESPALPHLAQPGQGEVPGLAGGWWGMVRAGAQGPREGDPLLSRARLRVSKTT